MNTFSLRHASGKQTDLFRIEFVQWDGQVVTLILRVRGYVFDPGQPGMLDCTDRWIPLPALISVQPYVSE